MNTLIAVSRFLPPVIVVCAFIFNPFAQAAESNPTVAQSKASEPAVQAAGKAGKVRYLRYDLGDGRSLYINEEKSFESYDNWLIEPATVELAKRQRSLSKRDRVRLAKMLAEIQSEETASTGVQVVSVSSPCTLKQRVKLKKLSLSESGSAGSQFNFMRSFGSTTIVAEVRDPVTDEIVFLYTEQVSLGGGTTGGGGPRIRRLGKAIQLVLANAHAVLLKAVPLREERITSRSSFGCEGQLGKKVVSLREAQGAVAAQ